MGKTTKGRGYAWVSTRDQGGAGVERLEPRTLFAAQVDPVLEWNNVLIDTLRADRVYPGPGFSSLHAAMMHTAIYDAVMAIDGGHAAYLGGARAAKHADRTAAVA